MTKKIFKQRKVVANPNPTIFDQDVFDSLNEQYSKLEIPDSKLYLTRAKGLSNQKLKPPKKGNKYAIYFNLNAMKGAVFGKIKKSPYSQSELKSMGTDRANMFLSAPIYSFKDKGVSGQVVSYSRTGILKDVQFKTSKKTIQGIRTKKAQTPCCYMVGTFDGKLTEKQKYNLADNWNDPMGQIELQKLGWREIIFNPFKFTEFQYLEDSQTFDALQADEVVFTYQPKELGVMPYLILALNPKG